MPPRGPCWRRALDLRVDQEAAPFAAGRKGERFCARCFRFDLVHPAPAVAAKAFDRYKRRGGSKRSPLPDFFIGAHAAVTGMTLLTRDPRRYRAYFPKLKIISP